MKINKKETKIKVIEKKKKETVISFDSGKSSQNL